MHDTAMEFGARFFETYLRGASGLTVTDIGAQDVQGSLRSVTPPGHRFVGVDFIAGKGVDVVLTDPYVLPFEDNSIDVAVSSSVFEHSEFFWLLFMEIMRVLKPSGLLYLNAPSNGNYHVYPVDCWRFYPDSGKALQNWARRNGMKTVMLESFTGPQKQDVWNDFVAVFLKDEAHVGAYPDRMVDSGIEFTNGMVHGEEGRRRGSDCMEDQQPRLLKRLRRKFFPVNRRGAA